MRKIALLLVCMIIGIVSANSQTSNALFDNTTHDFGQIEEQGGKVSHDFVFTNKTDKPITVTKVKASCGCTTPTWTNTPVEPGKTGTVTATYNPSGRPGKFNKTVTVTFADGDQAKLAIKGEVTREINVEAQFPVAMGDLRLKSNNLNFGNVAYGKTKTIPVMVYNNGASSLTPSFSGLPANITYTSVAIAPKTSGRIEFTFNAGTIKKYGRMTGSFSFVSDSNKLNYSADIIDDFAGLTTDQKNNAGKMNMNPTFLNFNKKTSTATVKFSNSGKSNLNIRAIQCSNPDIEVSKTSLTVKPNKIEEIKVKYPAGKIKSNTTSEILIYSDDPASPVKTIIIKAEP